MAQQTADWDQLLAMPELRILPDAVARQGAQHQISCKATPCTSNGQAITTATLSPLPHLMADHAHAAIWSLLLVHCIQRPAATHATFILTALSGAQGS